jgi:hypothetical protein
VVYALGGDRFRVVSRDGECEAEGFDEAERLADELAGVWAHEYVAAGRANDSDGFVPSAQPGESQERPSSE